MKTNFQGNIATLYQKWLDQTITIEEQQQLLHLLESSSAEEELSASMQQVWNELDKEQVVPAAYARERISIILKNHPVAVERNTTPATHRVHFLRTTWFHYAAVLLLLVGTGAYFWFHYNRQQTLVSNSNRLPLEIPPGKDGAILTLADGSQVVLDSLGNGVIATQSGSRVLLQDGQLAYDPTGKAAGEMLYNTMTTPKGRQFNVVLPDGTRVWLNASSSLRYPTAFLGKERLVTVMGEAYFEVAKDKAKPFLVKINNAATVEVLGTSFNVNAYEDEASINTTLLEGSVRVVSGRSEDGTTKEQVGQGDQHVGQNTRHGIVLKPGQQAQILVGQQTQPGIDREPSSSPIIKVVDNADIDKVMAWKNGAFNFEGASLQEVMRQLERWYDIQVVYEKGIPDIHFVGEMSRGISLAELIKVLEESEVHLRIEEGRRLVVMP